MSNLPSEDDYTTEGSDTDIEVQNKHKADPRPTLSSAAARSKPSALIELEKSVPREFLERLPDLDCLTMRHHNRRKALSTKLLIGTWHAYAQDEAGTEPSPVWVYLYPLNASFKGPFMEIEVERDFAPSGSFTLMYHETENHRHGAIKYLYPFSQAVSESELFVLANYYFLLAVTHRLLKEKPPLIDNGIILSRVLGIVCPRLPIRSGSTPVVPVELESDGLRQAEPDHMERANSDPVEQVTRSPVRKRRRH